MLKMFNRLFGRPIGSPSPISDRTVYMSAERPIGVSLKRDTGPEVVCLAFIDENHRRFTLHIPARHWQDIGRVLAQYAAFKSMRERGEREKATKAPAAEYRTQDRGEQLVALWGEWDSFCKLNGFTGDHDQPDTIAATRELTREHLAFLDQWRMRYAHLLDCIGDLEGAEAVRLARIRASAGLVN